MNTALGYFIPALIVVVLFVSAVGAGIAWACGKVARRADDDEQAQLRADVDGFAQPTRPDHFHTTHPKD